MIKIENAVPRNPDFKFREPVSLSVEDGEHVAFVGPNGGGKSLLVRMMLGHYPLLNGEASYCENVRFIAFRDSYGAADTGYYLQQRWNSQDRDEASPLILLSSGELRKYHINKALSANPRLLVIDKPFIGLDVAAREQFGSLLAELAAKGKVQIVLILARMSEIPDFITHVVPVAGMVCGAKVRREHYRESAPENPVIGVLNPPEYIDGAAFFKSSNVGLASDANDKVIEMHDVTIRYGKRVILNKLSWTVRRGEKWALLGPNGSGKSTLLSLICADNPQSYSCNISLFGSRRGSGESIWDIKKRIGYVSPEMHRAYSENIPAIKIVASGLYDSVGLYVQPKPEQYTVCDWWMNVFGIRDLRDRNFLSLSDGEQRLVLLTRAFVKDPELLILDEPMHGLDSHNYLLVSAIIESFCRRPDKTLIMVTHYIEELPEYVTKRLTLSL